MNYGPCICCEAAINAQTSRHHFHAVALCDSERQGERKQMRAICLIHVYVCIDMHVCLPTPPTSKPQMPEGQTSRHRASLLVPVAGTEWSEEVSSAAPSDGLILTPISVTFKSLSRRCTQERFYAYKRAATLAGTQRCSSHYWRTLWQNGRNTNCVFVFASRYKNVSVLGNKTGAAHLLIPVVSITLADTQTLH